MPAIPCIIAGYIKNEDAVAVENAVVYVYNKTKSEIHNGCESTFMELRTNVAGEFQCDLANFTNGWTSGDEMHITAFYENKAQHYSFNVTGNKSDITLTIRDLEPAVAIQKLLRIYLDDPNTTRNDSDALVKVKYDKNTLDKNDYPLVVINDIEESSKECGITNSYQAEERTTKINISVYIWSKQGDAQVFTIDSVYYEGTKLRDYLARKVSEVLRQEFYRRPSYTKNAIIQKFYDYKKTKMASLEFKESTDDGILKKELEIEIKSIAQ